LRRRNVFFILMRVLGSFDELSYLLLNCCKWSRWSISRSFHCLFGRDIWRNGRGSCLNTKVVRTALYCFTIIKCNHVLAMADCMQHIANKTFTDASFLIWVRVGYQFTERTGDATTSKQPLPRSMFGGSIRHKLSKIPCQLAVKIQTMGALTLTPTS
jgi:hypothetical protein